MATLLALVAGSNRALAQDTPAIPDSPRHDRVAARATADTSAPRPFDGLRLTNAQRKALKAATMETRAARTEILRRQAPGGRMSQTDRDLLIGLADKHNALVRAALTEDQRNQLAVNAHAEGERRARARTASRSHQSADKVP